LIGQTKVLLLLYNCVKFASEILNLKEKGSLIYYNKIVISYSEHGSYNAPLITRF
jgi:hypothetical protein